MEHSIQRAYVGCIRAETLFPKLKEHLFPYPYKRKVLIPKKAGKLGSYIYVRLHITALSLFLNFGVAYIAQVNP